MNDIETVKSCAEEVIKVLGTNYTEGVYEEAIMHEFRLRDIPYERQRNIEIIYKGYNIGMRKPDCILNPLWSGSKEEYLIEMKAVANIDKKYIMQAEVYLLSMNINRGVVLNFNTKTGNIDIQEVNRPQKILKKDIARLKKSHKKEKITNVLKKAGDEVLNCLGTEFFYYDNGIYIKAIGVELRLRGLNFHSSEYPILYKGFSVANYGYDYILDSGEIAKIFTYKKEEEIDNAMSEFKSYNESFGIKKGYILALPQNNEMKVIVKEIKI